MLTRANDSLIQEYLEIAEVTDDIGRFSTLITDDCSWTLQPTGYTFKGSEQVMAFAKMAGSMRVHDRENRIRITNWFTDGENLCVEYNHGAIVRRLRLRVTIHVCLVFHMRDGKFDRVREYCTFRDFLTLEEAVFRGVSGLSPILEGISGLRKQPLLPD
jgi:hypothetical protein